MEWSPTKAGLTGLSPQDLQALSRLKVLSLPQGAVLFQPGQEVEGYAIILSGRVDVSLSAASGSEILLYSVVPGQSCIQTTMGLLGDAIYSAGAQTASPTQLVMVPRPLFTQLMDSTPSFRAMVFSAFAGRMGTMMELLEKVAFARVECRIAERLLALATGPGPVQLTQSELAAQVGTAREVVSRRLENWAQRGLVRTARGQIELCNRPALQAIADAI